MGVRDKAATSVRRREKKEPDYVVRARNGRGWRTVGAAWKSDRDDSNVVASITLNVVPVGFDGVLKVMHPLPDDEEQTDVQD
jgi:hypothetical protein